MESSNSGSFQSSSGGGADNEYEYDDSNNNFTQSQSKAISSAAANNNFFINNNNNNPTTTTTNSFINHQQLLQPSYNTSSFYNHHPPVQPTSLSSIQDPSWTQTITIPTTFTHQNPTTTKTHQIGVTKKRTRASRRAPTTVLTTDTTNFRQMVQEFTGIPTAPFTRLFRPKIQSPFLNNNNNNNNNIVAESSTSNYHLSSPSTTFLDLQQNPPMFSFQSLPHQNGKLETNFEGVMNGGSNLNSALEMNAFSASADQVQGNEGSWICPSN